MLTELCGYLKNWFNRKIDGTDYPKFKGEIVISGGEISTGDTFLLDGQYFRIVGSVLNDGVWEYSDSIEGLRDEVFEGEIWSMAVPPDVIELAREIADWRALYDKADSAALSPFQSESFGGYSYSKSTGQSYAGGMQADPTSWQTIFGGRLTRYKKL